MLGLKLIPVGKKGQGEFITDEKYFIWWEYIIS